MIDTTTQAQLALLDDLYKQGVLDAEAYRQQRARLESPSVIVDQREQTVERQTNVGRDAIDIDGDANIIGSDNLVQVYKVYQSAPGKAHLTETDVQRIAREYLTWVRNNYRGARLYGAAHTPQSGQGKPRRELRDIFVPLTLARFRPPQEEELRELADPHTNHNDALARAWMRYRARQESMGELSRCRTCCVAPRVWR